MLYCSAPKYCVAYIYYYIEISNSVRAFAKNDDTILITSSGGILLNTLKYCTVVIYNNNNNTIIINSDVACSKTLKRRACHYTLQGRNVIYSSERRISRGAVFYRS